MKQKIKESEVTAVKDNRKAKTEKDYEQMLFEMLEKEMLK